MAKQVFECAEDAGGCGVIWTPVVGNRRPVKHQPEWAWCPDCIKAGANHE